MEVLNNPFEDIMPRIVSEKKKDDQESKKNKKSGVKNFKLLSFGEEAEEDEEESEFLNKQFSGKKKSAHDCLSDPKLSAQSVMDLAELPTKKRKEDRSSDWESDDETRTPEEMAAMAKEQEAMKERIKNKLKDRKVQPKLEMKDKDKTKDKEENEDTEIEEYYLGKDRDEERKRKAEAIRKEIRELKRTVQNEKKAKKADQEQQVEKEESKNRVMKAYIENREKYKEAKAKLPKKGKTRENLTMELLSKFKCKLQNAKEHTKNNTTKSDSDASEENDESWMVQPLHCEEKAPVLAKDASTKDDDWFEIYDPRNPLNKRRRGEKSCKSKDDNNYSYSKK